MNQIRNTGRLPKLIADLERAKRRGGPVLVESALGSSTIAEKDVGLHLGLLMDFAEMARRLRQRSVTAGIRKARESGRVRKVTGGLDPVRFIDAARRFAGGEKVDDIARDLNVKPGTLRRRLNRAGATRR